MFPNSTSAFNEGVVNPYFNNREWSGSNRQGALLRVHEDGVS